MTNEINKIYKNQASIFPIVLVFLEIVTFLSTDMYLPALPSMVHELNITQELAQYTLAFWFMGSMSMQLILGPIAEIYGRKSVLSAGIVLFIITSIACANVTNINLFLLARFLQGTTVCAVIVAGYATIHELYSGKKAVQILAIMSSVTVLAPALGPLLGALIITYINWQKIFVILAVCASIGLIGLYLYMPSNKPRNNPDVISQISFSKILIDYKLLITNKQFMQATLLYSFLIINFFLWIVEAPFIIIKQYGMSEMFFGIAQFFVFGGYICGAQFAKRLVTKVSASRMCDIGLFITAVAIIMLNFLSYFDFNLIIVIAAMVGVAFGSASLSGLLNRLAIESAEQPMAQRVAVYSLSISLAASLGSSIVSKINDMSFYNVSCLMTAFFVCAIIIYSNLRGRISIN